VWDGKPGPSYDLIKDDSWIFSNDGKRMAYVAVTGTKENVVVDNRPGLKLKGSYGHPEHSPTTPPPAQPVYTTNKTGRILTDDNWKLLTEAEQQEWKEAVEEYYRLIAHTSWH